MTAFLPGAQGFARIAIAFHFSIRLVSGSSSLSTVSAYLEADGGPGLLHDTLSHLLYALRHSEHFNPVLQREPERKLLLKYLR